MAHTHLPISQFLDAYFSPSYRHQNQTTTPAPFHPTVAMMISRSSGYKKYIHLLKPRMMSEKGILVGWGVQICFKVKEDRKQYGEPAQLEIL